MSTIDASNDVSLDSPEAGRIEMRLEVGEIFHLLPGQDPQPGRDPERGTYQSYAAFSDPDGNGWLLQEITTRLPGR